MDACLRRERELGFNGVHRIAPDGTLTNATADTEYPNGIAFSPDERVLYVAITRRDDGCTEEKARGEVCKPCHDLLYISGDFRRLYPVGISAKSMSC